MWGLIPERVRPLSVVPLTNALEALQRAPGTFGQNLLKIDREVWRNLIIVDLADKIHLLDELASETAHNTFDNDFATDGIDGCAEVTAPEIKFNRDIIFVDAECRFQSLGFFDRHLDPLVRIGMKDPLKPGAFDLGNA